MTKPRHHLLYRVFNETGDLLYVGATTNPSLRFHKHSRETDWWGEAARIELQHFDNVDDLLDAESDVIGRENPKYNVLWKIGKVRASAMKGPRRPRGDGTIFQRASDGMWIGKIDVLSFDGKRRQKVVSSKDRETAERKLAALKAEIAKGQSV